MTDHTHLTLVDGCYRCDLHRDEVTGLVNTTPREWQAFNTGWDASQEQKRDVLDDLVERLEGASESLSGLPTSERLQGKIEGVRLALSYVREELPFS